MAQKVNLHNSRTLYGLLKAWYVSVGFLHFALFMRLMVLLPLVGRKFLPGGMHVFFSKSVYTVTTIELILSVVKLIPIGPAQFVLGNCLKCGVVWVLSKDIKLQRHTVYSLYIAELGLIGVISYSYHLQKLMYLGHVHRWLKGLYDYSTLVEFPLRAIVEFAILFMGLKYVHGYAEYITKSVLLVFIPVKYILYKRMLVKFFYSDTIKTD